MGECSGASGVGEVTESATTVIVMGKGELAIRVARWFTERTDYELVAALPSAHELPWGRSFRAWARESHAAVVESGHYRDVAALLGDAYRVDLGISIFYDRIVPPSFIDRFARLLNIHNGPLPRYQGVSPINWALKNGEAEHGITIHEITPGIDDGPIVAQAKYSIYPDFDEVIDVHSRSIEYGWTLFHQTMPVLDRIRARPQDSTRALYYGSSQNTELGDRRGPRRDAS